MSDEEDQPQQQQRVKTSKGRDKESSSDAIPTEASPGEAYLIFIEMNNLSNKLKLLNYEDEYVTKWRMKPISRHYFAIPSNPGEQSHSFISLSAWLINQAGGRFDKPQETDDPNSLISGILSALRKYGHEVDFGANRLKAGSGDKVVYALNRLADEALKAKKFSWMEPQYPSEQFEDEADQPKDEIDEAELDMNKIEEDMHRFEQDDEDEEENIINMEALSKMNNIKPISKDLPEMKHEEILESKTDATEWKLEVERVLPQLKVTIKTDHKDWRAHIEQMHGYQNSINESLTVTKTYLEKLYDEISKTLEKIGSREKYINTQLEEPMSGLRNYQDKLAEIKDTYKSRSSGINERTRVLADISNELQRIKEEMEEAGQSMTDGSPLIRVKKAMENIRNDMKNMDVRIGVLEHILMQSRMRSKDLIHEQRDK